MRRRVLAFAALAASLVPFVAAQPAKDDAKKDYIKKATRSETVRATLAAFGLPNLEGKWHFAGPFPLPSEDAFAVKQLPEVRVDLKATYDVKGGKTAGWQEVPKFEPGKPYDLERLFPADRTHAVAYLYHEFDSPEAFALPLSLGSDDALAVSFNGESLLSDAQSHPLTPEQFRVELKVRAGKNRLLLKVGQYTGQWAVQVSPEPVEAFGGSILKRFERDFPPTAVLKASSAAASAEAAHYAVSTLPVPDDCVLEVGGLAFRPDGKLLACTRRGEVWLVHDPLADDPAKVRFTRFATGLHEALGLSVQDNNTVHVIQRPELTRLVDRDGDGTADEYATVCDKWGVSGDYHEYAFGPARDKEGNFFVTLNVGFSGGHQAKAAWRGWCLKLDPKTGAMEPWAYGLRSPNGINFSPEGELFYADNQGEWAASNKLSHVKKGKFYGHQAGLRWVKDSPFAGAVPDKVASGMLYDGGKGPAANAPAGFPDLEPPAVWFPYGRMGNSASEPIWDTTGGKFGPFAGQCFIGDQTKATVMRVALEKVNGVYQGACFPFRAGFQCGVNRLAFAPDGSLFVGQTNRGWGSIGGKPYGLQRVAYAGKLPFEVHHISLTKTGFDLTFTKPLDPASAAKPAAASVGSYTYAYHSGYGCPEIDKRAEPLTAATPSKDGLTLSLSGPNLKKGRVYEIRLDGLRSADGAPVLHPEAYYTVNELVK